MQLEMMDEIEYGDDDFTPIPLALDEEPPEVPGDEANMLLREDEQKGWMERTLNAAGLGENEDDPDDMVPQVNRNHTPPRNRTPMRRLCPLRAMQTRFHVHQKGERQERRGSANSTAFV